MSNTDFGTLQSKTYNLYLSSNDRISGNHNNAVFNINWNDFLPMNYNLYKMVFSFQTAGGYYKDPTGNAIVYSSGKIVFNTQGRTFSFDSSTMSSSNTIGYIQRDIQTAGSSANTISCFYMQNPPKTVMRPSQNNINIQIFNTYNTYNNLLTTTDNAGTASSDMTPWSMIIEFIAIENSIINDVRSQFT